MPKSKEKILLIKLWEKNEKFLAWTGLEYRKKRTNEEPFSLKKDSTSTFYFYLDDFKNARIKDNSNVFQELKISYSSLTKFHKEAIRKKINQLNDETNLFQKILYLNLENQEWLLKSFDQENLINAWVLKAEAFQKDINESIEQKKITINRKNRLVNLNKSFNSKINYLKERTLTFKQSLYNLKIEIDDLLEKTDDFLNKPNNFQEDLLKEKYEDLKQKNLVLESDYVNLRIEFKQETDKLIAHKLNIKNIIKRLNKKNIQKFVSVKISDSKEKLQQFDEVLEAEENIGIYQLQEVDESVVDGVDEVVSSVDVGEIISVDSFINKLETEKNELFLQLQEAYNIINNKDNEILKLKEELNQANKKILTMENKLETELTGTNKTIHENNKKMELDAEQFLNPLKKQKISHNNLLPSLNLASSSNHHEAILTDFDYDMFMQLTDNLSKNSDSAIALSSVIIDDLNLEIEEDELNF